MKKSSRPTSPRPGGAAPEKAYARSEQQENVGESRNGHFKDGAGLGDGCGKARPGSC